MTVPSPEPAMSHHFSHWALIPLGSIVGCGSMKHGLAKSGRDANANANAFPEELRYDPRNHRAASTA